MQHVHIFFLESGNISDKSVVLYVIWNLYQELEFVFLFA